MGGYDVCGQEATRPSGMAAVVFPHPLPGPGTHLLLEQQGYTGEELVAVQGGQCNVKEEPIQHRLGDPLQREW